MSEIKTPAEILTEDPAIEFHCNLCGAAVQVPHFLTATANDHGVMCDACCDKDASEVLQRSVASSAAIRASQWAQVCPPGFQATEISRLPKGHRLEKVLSWRYGPKNLFLMGDTRTGKSRCAWLLARREFMAGKSVRSLDYGAGMTYSGKFAASAADAENWLTRFCSCDLLLLDDTFKSKLTESFEQAMFIVIARRSENQLPTIVTTNDNPDTLAGRMTEDRGPALLARIKEDCQTIVFGL